MKTYKIKEYANVVFTYMVDADSEDDAVHRVNMGIVEPKTTDFFEYEVAEVMEFEDAK